MYQECPRRPTFFITPNKQKEPDMVKKLTPKDNNVEKSVDEKTVKDFVLDAKSIASKTSKLNGDKSALFNLAEKCGINKAAIKDVMKIHSMEDGTRSDYLAAFDLYRKYMGLDTYDQEEMFKKTIKGGVKAGIKEVVKEGAKAA